jgi:hypothetical protein
MSDRRDILRSAAASAEAADRDEMDAALCLLRQARNTFGGRPAVFVQALQSLAYTETLRLLGGEGNDK